MCDSAQQGPDRKGKPEARQGESIGETFVMTSAAIYARYSSDLQRDASIEDQIRLCKERAKREGWRVVNCYSDHAISGASLIASRHADRYCRMRRRKSST